MSYGYTTRLVQTNKDADRKLLGVRLGRTCIKRNVPVVHLSHTLGVSRQTIYNWFSGTSTPQAQYVPQIQELLHSLIKQDSTSTGIYLLP